MTSNGVETTRDFANRASIVRIRKREGVIFHQYPEGDLLAHVRARQPYYLGCVFAVIQSWIAAGCQVTNETRHDFREWATTLDWIVQKIFAVAPLMDGHQSAQERVSNPALTFLRKLALAVVEEGRGGEKLMASQLYEIADAAELDVPGLKDADEDKGKRIIGGIMARLFKDGNRLEVDGFAVQREGVQTERKDGRGVFESKTYQFSRISTDASNASNASKGSKCQEKSPVFLEVSPLAGLAGEPVNVRPVPAPEPDEWETLTSKARPLSLFDN